MIAFDQLLKKSEHARITVKTVVEPVAEALGNTRGDEPQVLCPSGAARGVKEDPRDPLDGNGSAARHASGCRRAKSALLEFLARGGEAAAAQG